MHFRWWNVLSICVPYKEPRIILVLVWCKSIQFSLRYARKRFLHFRSNWPWLLSLTFDLKFALQLLVSRYVANFEVPTVFRFRRNGRHGADRRTGQHTDGLSPTLYAASSKGGRIIRQEANLSLTKRARILCNSTTASNCYSQVYTCHILSVGTSAYTTWVGEWVGWVLISGALK